MGLLAWTLFLNYNFFKTGFKNHETIALLLVLAKEKIGLLGGQFMPGGVEQSLRECCCVLVLFMMPRAGVHQGLRVGWMTATFATQRCKRYLVA